MDEITTNIQQSAISDSEDYSAISAKVSEFQRDHSVIPSVTAYHSWFVKPKRDELTEYFEFHPHQPETTKFNATTVYLRHDGSGSRLQRLWLSYCEEKEALFCNLCIAYGTTTSSNQNPSKFLTGFNSWKHTYQLIDEHESCQKHKPCVEAHIQFSSNKTVVDLLTVSQTSLHNKQVMQRRQILDRVVSIVKMIGKRGTNYRGTGCSEAVSTLCDEKVDHGTFLETVLLLAKCDNILKCHLENVIKKCLQNKPDKHKHNRANRNTFICKAGVNSIIAIISKLMKKEISNSVREAGIYSVRIGSTQDITSTDKCSVILRFLGKTSKNDLLPLLAVIRQLELTCPIC